MKNYILIILIIFISGLWVGVYAAGEFEIWRGAGNYPAEILYAIKKILSNDLTEKCIPLGDNVEKKNAIFDSEKSYKCLINGGDCCQGRCELSVKKKCNEIKRRINVKEEESNNINILLKKIVPFEARLKEICLSVSRVKEDDLDGHRKMIDESADLIDAANQCLKYHLSFFTVGDNSLTDAANGDSTEKEEEPDKEMAAWYEKVKGSKRMPTRGVTDI